MILTKHWQKILSRNAFNHASQSLRTWAIAHADKSSRGSARNALRAAGPRIWSNDHATISLIALPQPALLQLSRVARHPDPELPAQYTAYTITWMPHGSEHGFAAALTSTDDLQQPHVWPDDASPAALDSIMRDSASGPESAAHASHTMTGLSDNPISDILAHHNLVAVMPWTDSDLPDPRVIDAVEKHSSIVHPLIIDHATHRSISRQLTDADLLMRWQSATFAAFTRQPPPANHSVDIITADPQAVIDWLEQRQRDHVTTDYHNITQFLFKALEFAATYKNPSSTEPGPSQPNKSANVLDGPITDQRIFRLEDQLRIANAELAQANADTVNLRRERDQAYQALADAGNVPEDSQNEVTEAMQQAARDRRAALEAAIADGRFENVRFLKSALRTLDDHSRPNPSSDNLIEAIDAIDLVATTWAESSDHNIGPWDAYFDALTGWHYSATEGENTRQQYASHRNFHDDSNGQSLTIWRHLTNHSTHAGLQIYFDSDPEQNGLVIAYIGPHLPYSTQV